MTDLWYAIQSAISQVNTAAEAVFHLLRTLSAVQCQVFAATMESMEAQKSKGMGGQK